MSAMIEPTSITKAKVLRIQGVVKDVLNSSNILSNVCTKVKSLTMNKPKTIPLKRDKTTFLVRMANVIAKREGTNERAEGSMTRTLLLKELNHFVQIFHGRVHTLFLFSEKNQVFYKKA